MAGESLLASLAQAQQRAAEVVALRGGQAVDRVLGLIRLFTDSTGQAVLPTRQDIADITDLLAREDADTEQLLAERATDSGTKRRQPVAVSELLSLIEELTAQMHAAAAELQFELAARLRDEVGDLKRELRGMQEAVGR